MPKINEIVSYGAQGVCKITGITEKNFGDTELSYYVLEPVYRQNSTIFVPVNNQKLVAKMERTLTGEEVLELIRQVLCSEAEWIENEQLRRQHHQEIMANGDKKQLFLALKALCFHKREQFAKGKKLHLADERFFKEAEELLYHEFAFALELDPSEVPKFITEQAKEK